MTAVTREALCRSEFCPDPRNPDWHACIVDGNPQVEHAHIVARSRAPSRRKDKNNVVALCHAHHELQTLNKWAFHEQAMPFDGLLHQWLTDERGATVWRRDVASSDGSKAGFARVLVSEPSLGASSATDEEGGRPGQESRGVSTAASSVAPDAPQPGVGLSEGGGTMAPPSPNLADDAGDASDGADVELPPNRDAIPRGVQPQPIATTVPSIAESLKDNGAFDFERWKQQGQTLRNAIHSTPWAFGDWAIVGEDGCGEQAWNEISEGFDKRDYAKVRNWIWVARSIPPTERVPSLSWSHHRAVAHLEREERLAVLTEAAEKGLDRDGLAALLPATTVAKPTTKWTLDELRERAEGFWYAAAKNNGRRFLAVFLESLEGPA